MAETRIVLSQAALAHNLLTVKQQASNSRVIAMIKANGYGHGFDCVSQGLANADAFGVARLSEAQELRYNGFVSPLIIFQDCLSTTDFTTAANLNCQVVVHSLEQVEVLTAMPKGQPLNVWLKINTGMNRLGIAPAKITAVYQALAACSWLTLEGVMSHFSDADEGDTKKTEQQMALFDTAVAKLPLPQSLANSAGLLRYPASKRDWVRPGIMLYGISPFAQSTGVDFNLQPVMHFQSYILAIQHCQAGDRIGYGGDYRCERATEVAIVAAGYGDGYPRHAKTGTPVLLSGQRCPLLGRVSMDMIAIDITGKNGQINDPVTLWGDGLAVEEIALHAQTIPYELCCGITSRVKRVIHSSN